MVYQRVGLSVPEDTEIRAGAQLATGVESVSPTIHSGAGSKGVKFSGHILGDYRYC